MALKDNHGGAPWFQWEEPLKRRESGALEEARWRLREDIAFHKMLQYLFFRQWKLLKQYANDKDIRIIGDLPIYVAMDSADVWASPELFRLDEQLNPVEVAGCPPDGFTEDGQLWGNPIYDWDRMKQDGYAWWIRRIDAARSMYDTVRIDHFRGFDSYYCIPAGDTTAKNGQWRHGVGIEFFLVLEEALGKLSILAEDLGYLTPSVRKLLEDTGFPGMKVLQFAFDSREDSDYLPHNYKPHCVVYTGTHDNDTILGWMEHAPAGDVAFAKQYLRLNEQEGYHWGMLKSAWASVGETVIVQMQDLLGLGGEARMNTPSTLGGNWMWRMREEQMDSALAARLHELMALYRRLPQ